MKISMLSTEQALDCLCEITPYVNNIAIDEELMATLKTKIGANGMTRAQNLLVGAEKINAIIPIVLKKHREDVYGIISVLNEKTIEEIGKQNFIKTGMQIREIVMDRELLDFFKSFVSAE